MIPLADINQLYRHMSYPLPALAHANYQFYTPSGQDKRWIGTGELEEGGMQWVGGLMCVLAAPSACAGAKTRDAQDNRTAPRAANEGAFWRHRSPGPGPC